MLLIIVQIIFLLPERMLAKNYVLTGREKEYIIKSKKSLGWGHSK